MISRCSKRSNGSGPWRHELRSVIFPWILNDCIICGQASYCLFKRNSGNDQTYHQIPMISVHFQIGFNHLYCMHIYACVWACVSLSVVAYLTSFFNCPSSSTFMNLFLYMRGSHFVCAAHAYGRRDRSSCLS